VELTIETEWDVEAPSHLASTEFVIVWSVENKLDKHHAIQYTMHMD